jgi:hypothetical protein
MDVWFLPAPDSCSLSITKMIAWWRRAAAIVVASGSLITHVAKVDDDSFVNVPKLESELFARLHCHHSLYYGALAWSAYSPANFRQCGFAMQGIVSNKFYKDYGCAEQGADPPFPFAVGALQVLAPTIVLAIVSDSEVAAFVERSERELDMRENQREDIALGYWISRLHHKQQLSVTYARLPSDPHHQIRIDLGCTRVSPFHVTPDTEGLVILHGLKFGQSMEYVWNVTRRERPFDARTCSRVSGAV